MNLLEALNEAGISYKEHKSREGEIYLCCPFCTERQQSPDTRYRLSVNYVTGMGHCHNCDWSSRDALKSLAYMLRLGLLEKAERPGQTSTRPEPVEIPKGFELLADVDEHDGPLWTMKKYLLKRGTTEKQIRDNKIGACFEGRFAWSIVFPVYYGDLLAGLVSRDTTGQRLNWQGQPLRYLNSVGTKVLYNCPKPMPKNATVVVLEGIFKAFAVENLIRKLNVKNWFAVATLGRSMTNTQVELLKGAKEIVVFPDPGKDGRVGFLGLAQQLSPLFNRVSLAYPLPELQADEMSSVELAKHLKNRRLYSPALELLLKSKEVFGEY